MRFLYVFMNELKEILSGIKFNIFVYIVMPFALAALNGVIYEQYFNQEPKLPEFKISIIDEDKGQIALSIKEIFKGSNLKDSITLREDRDFESIEEDIEKGDISAAIIVPKDFSKKTLLGENASLKVIKSPAQELNGSIVSEIVEAYTNNLNMNIAINKTLNEEAINIDSIELQNELSKIMSQNYIKEGLFENHKVINSKQYYAVSMLIMVSLFLTTVGASNIIKERESGTLKRLHSTSMSKMNFLLGKTMAIFLIAVIEVGVYILLTSAILKTSWGSNISSLSIVILSHGAAIAGISTLAGSIFKSQKSLKTVLPIVIMIMAVFGGTFYSIDSVTGFMRNVIKTTLNYWLTNSYTNIMVGSNISNISTNIFILLSIGVIGFAIGTMKFKFDN